MRLPLMQQFPFVFSVAWRYLQSKSNNYLSFITVMTTLGFSLGSFALIMAFSVMDGFEIELRDKFLAANAHVVLYSYPHGIKQPDASEKKVVEDFEEYVSAASQFVYLESLVSHEGFTKAVILRGILPERREKVQKLSDYVEPKQALFNLEIEKRGSTSSLPGIILGKGIVDDLSAKIGSTVTLLGKPTENDEQITKRRFEITGIYTSGLTHYDSKIGLVGLKEAQDLAGLGSRVTGIEMGLKDPDQSPKVARLMEEKYQNSVNEWQSYNSRLFAVIDKHKKTIGFLVSLIAIVAALNVFTVMFVVVSFRRRDIAILKSLGANHRLVTLIFAAQSALYSVVGTLIGVAVAIVVIYSMQEFNLIKLPEIYLLDRLPFAFSLGKIIVISAGSVALALLAAVIPCLSAVKSSITGNLHHPH